MKILWRNTESYLSSILARSLFVCAYKNAIFTMSTDCVQTHGTFGHDDMPFKKDFLEFCGLYLSF